MAVRYAVCMCMTHLLAVLQEAPDCIGITAPSLHHHCTITAPSLHLLAVLQEAAHCIELMQ